MDGSSIHISFSNRIELLADGLKEFLYTHRRSAFEKIMVVVPSLAMKNWLMHYLANDSELQIAFGFEVLYPHEALYWIIKHLGKKREQEVPDLMQFALLIEQAMKSDLKHLFKELFQEEGDRRRQGRARTEVAIELAHTFQKWSEFGSDDIEGWQGEIWKEIFCNEAWLPLNSFLDGMQIEESPFLAQMHLFGLSYLSEVKQRFFTKVAENLPLRSWILSPSRMFWSDLLSKKEQLRAATFLRKRGVKEKQLEGLWEEGHTLLANNGKLGREWMKQLEELPIESSEIYQVPSSVKEHDAYTEFMLDGVEEYPSESLSLLQAIQTDMTLLRSSEEPLALEPNDRSLEIHQAPSILREVQALYQTLLRAVKEKAIAPHEMLVLVPDIERYAPFIRTVFESADSFVKAEILDRPVALSNSYIQTFLCFLDLGQSRWELEQLFTLIENPVFRKKTVLTLEELLEVKGLLRREGVHWGLDAAHRQEVMQGNLLDKSSQGSWEAAIDAFCTSLSSGSTKTKISFTQVETIEKLLTLLQELKKDLLPFLQEPLHSFISWANLLRVFLEKYFAPLSVEDQEGEELLKTAFQQLSQFEDKFKEDVGFQSLKIYLNQLLQNPDQNFREHNLQAVRFCALLPMRLVPARVIALLGLNSFPRQDKNRLKTNSYIPSATDYDRFSFLESLMSVREKWILSYVSSPGDEPSCLVHELLQYLDEHYSLGQNKPSELLHYTHPELVYDPLYFSPLSKIPSYSMAHFRSARRMLNPAKISYESLFQSPWPHDQLDFEKLPKHLTITQLKAFFNHPIKHYLNQSLGIYLNAADGMHDSMQEFEMNVWPTQWIKWTLCYPLDQVLELIEEKGQLPVEPFKTAAKKRLKRELQELLDAFSEAGIKEIFEIEFSHGCEALTQISATRWQAPALQIEFGSRKMTLTGILPCVTNQGFVSFREASAETVMFQLPELLLHNSLPRELSKKTLLFPKKGKAWDCSRLNSWNELLANFARSFHQPLPLYAPWIAPILAGNSEQLLKAMQQSVEPSFTKQADPYLVWAMPKPSLEHSNKVIALWKSDVEQLFGPIYKQWEGR